MGMKKYTLFLFILAFILGLFNINVNLARAFDTENSGCQVGDMYSRTTGKACGTPTFTECRSGDLFSSVTGQRCNTQVFTFTQTLRYGMTNNTEVIELQRFLIAKGYLQGTPNGMIYQDTQNAIKRFQTAYGLTADGIVGRKTRMVLNTMQSNSVSNNETASWK